MVKGMKVSKIISGGQTGADQGGLEAGKVLGIETGGTAPPNFLTEDGPNPSLLKKYGLVEGPPDPSKYPKRTKLNVKDSSGTVIFGNTGSPGSKLTVRYCLQYNKPFILNPTSRSLRHWIEENNIVVLNVAGNRETKSPGIHKRVKSILLEL